MSNAGTHRLTVDLPRSLYAYDSPKGCACLSCAQACPIEYCRLGTGWRLHWVQGALSATVVEIGSKVWRDSEAVELGETYLRKQWGDEAVNQIAAWMEHDTHHRKWAFDTDETIADPYRPAVSQVPEEYHQPPKPLRIPERRDWSAEAAL